MLMPRSNAGAQFKPSPIHSGPLPFFRLRTRTHECQRNAIPMTRENADQAQTEIKPIPKPQTPTQTYTQIIPKPNAMTRMEEIALDQKSALQKSKTLPQTSHQKFFKPTTPDRKKKMKKKTMRVVRQSCPRKTRGCCAVV